MLQDLSPEQLAQLKSLGILNEEIKKINSPPLETATPSPSEPVINTPPSVNQPLTQTVRLKVKLPQVNFQFKSPVYPLLSISGLTLMSLGGLILLKGNGNTTANLNNNSLNNLEPNIEQPSSLSPTQVPKSIQHYLLTSQQYFTQALQNQTSGSNQQEMANLLNQSILAATESINEFPQDYRGYQQRGRIYQSLVDSKPEFLSQAITDLSLAYKYNPSSAELTHDLANLYAKKGDAQNTLLYLAQTVNLEPTKAQNFYDLAKIQQQTGLIPQAIETYNRLLSLVTDPTQKSQVETEKASLEQLASQNPNVGAIHESPTPSLPEISLPDNPPTLQAMGEDSGFIIAAPEESKKVEVQNLTDSNSLSGTATLPANQKEITLANSNLSPASQVYISVIKGGKNQNLQVLSKSDQSFVVGFDSAIPEEVEFKWWIIN